MADTENTEQIEQTEIEEPQKISKSKIFLYSVLIIIIGGFLYYNTFFPAQLMNYGKKCLENRQLGQALRIFRYLGDLHPQDIEPIYYEVLTLGKMPPTYINQKRLYEISQYDDCDEASTLAHNILANIRMQIDQQAGANYIDNVLYKEVVTRWNNANPISYAITKTAPTSDIFQTVVDKAFQQWSTATNGQFKFVQNEGAADIVVHVVYALPEDETYTTRNSTAVTIANINENKLNKMDIYVKSADDKGNPFPAEKLYSLLLHEIGHALGIGGHSIQESDIMYHDGDIISEETLPKHISQRDINTLNLLYKMVPDAINVELPESVKNNLLYHEVITTYPGENFEIETQRLIQELKDNKKDVVKWVDLATNYAIKRQYPRANYILERILPLVTRNENNQFAIYYNMALNYYRMKDYPLAERYLSMAKSISADKDTEMLSAFIEAKEGREETAKSILRDLQKAYPGDIEVNVKLAEIYYKENRKKESKKIIAELIKENPDAARDRRVIKYKG